jgi:hypothetical protein
VRRARRAPPGTIRRGRRSKGRRSGEREFQVTPASHNRMPRLRCDRVPPVWSRKGTASP